MKIFASCVYSFENRDKEDDLSSHFVSKNHSKNSKNLQFLVRKMKEVKKFAKTSQCYLNCRAKFFGKRGLVKLLSAMGLVQNVFRKFNYKSLIYTVFIANKHYFVCLRCLIMYVVSKFWGKKYWWWNLQIKSVSKEW